MTRSFRLPNVTVAQVVTGVKVWNVLPFMAASTYCLYLLLMRWIWYVDFLGGFAFIVGCAICAVFFAYNKEDSTSSDLRSEKYKLKNRIARQIILLVPMIALFFVGGSSSGYRFNYATGESTITRDFLPVSPFSEQSVFYVNKYQNQNVDVDIITKDGVPLRCHVIVNGIILDELNPRELEKRILSLNPAMPPNSQISSSVLGALSASSARVLSVKTTVEIAQENQFLIPYSIGTPLGNVFERYMLRWQDGAVGFSCRVQFN